MIPDGKMLNWQKKSHWFFNDKYFGIIKLLYKYEASKMKMSPLLKDTGSQILPDWTMGENTTHGARSRTWAGFRCVLYTSCVSLIMFTCVHFPNMWIQPSLCPGGLPATRCYQSGHHAGSKADVATPLCDKILHLIQHRPQEVDLL